MSSLSVCWKKTWFQMFRHSSVTSINMFCWANYSNCCHWPRRQGLVLANQRVWMDNHLAAMSWGDARLHLVDDTVVDVIGVNRPTWLVHQALMRLLWPITPQCNRRKEEDLYWFSWLYTIYSDSSHSEVYWFGAAASELMTPYQGTSAYTLLRSWRSAVLDLWSGRKTWYKRRPCQHLKSQVTCLFFWYSHTQPKGR